MKNEGIYMSEEEKNIQESNNFEQSPDSIVSSIATSEAREAESHVQGAQQEKADFSSMFGVQSEETTEEKELAKSTNTEIPRVLEVKEEDREVVVQLSDEEKKANHKKNFNNDERLLYQIEPDKTGNPLVVAFFFFGCERTIRNAIRFFDTNLHIALILHHTIDNITAAIM